MPRITRGIADSFVYHILNRGNGKQKVFHKDKDYEAFIHLMKEAKERYSVKLFAYCLMPNHFHMVVKPIYGKDLSRYMQWLRTSHVRRYHSQYGTTGHVWQGRFKSFIVQEDDHLITVLRYVEGNPVRAGLTSSSRDWVWSSHRETLGESAMGFTDEIPIVLPDEWGKFVDEPVTEKELAIIRESAHRQAPFGTFLWKSMQCKQFGLESTMRKRGRPMKQKDSDFKM